MLFKMLVGGHMKKLHELMVNFSRIALKTNQDYLLSNAHTWHKSIQEALYAELAYDECCDSGSCCGADDASSNSNSECECECETC